MHPSISGVDLPAAGLDSVRQRGPALATSEEGAEAAPNASQPVEKGVNGFESRAKKTYGRTPGGTVFVVPTTHDMVSQLLDPREPKNLSDVLVLLILALHIWAAYALPANLKRPVFAVVFLFWRASYNVGIGYLLTVQSKYKLLVTWARRWRLFENPETGANPRPWLYSLLKGELEAKIPEDYKFEEAPLEYNTWLVFRRVVDLILMCDFVSYCLFAIVCGHKPEGEALGMTLCRWGAGITLVGFNLWVKLDAHRVVKDYAWYWGDFFYLVEQELTFDGVFEMAPHPMYSIGYSGYYGISMMAASYDVLFISILAHAAQFGFLAIVENPHIEKTYNPPPPRLRAESSLSETNSPNFDLFRTTDYSVLLLVGYLSVLAVVTPNTPVYQAIFVVHALLWRLWYSVGLGVILTMQSKEKMFTRHFLKYGESAGEAWRQWKGMYHLSNTLCHASFIAACWKMYNFPEDWNYGWVLLKHVVGASLIALQVWTATSIYESLGEFGWFYGDFFLDSTGRLTYTSIYRFLNNPERVIGTAGLWGAALITWSRSIFLMAIVGHILTLGFISYVEKPHMQKVYGRNLRDEAGLTKFIKRSLPPQVKELQMSVDKVLDETRHFVDDFVEAARARLASGSSTIARDTSALFNKYPARLTLSRISPDVAGYDPKHYWIVLEGTPLVAASEKATGKESASARVPKAVKTKVFEYGAPINVKWTAPANHSKKDWVGLYMVTDNRSRESTEVPSLGRWVPTCAGEYDTTTDQGIISWDQPIAGPKSPDGDFLQGEMVFEGDKLWWTQGVYEFRYHHGGGHNVMSISEPFEVRIGKFDDNDEDVVSYLHGAASEKAVEEALLPIVRNCLDRDPEIAPNTTDEPFGSHVERDSKYARRVVYAIHHMFGIEFAPAVVPADGNVKKLAWRVCNAKQVLAPYSMSQSRGSTTPVTEKFPEAL
ncbi:phospholipid methyltransferase-domain-containing protein [Lasiosphaeria miniovina]|uniref:Phosphatidylethanolamine N-methyltransferase n=1 Tax=Lasiosphaeria miniovina TaxID=1954250 RepID=A0AA40AM18_9PEZI|nr:phospholipid methyltransferase-domain-containing protein [Lasiosphaeria miniovina]KAK0718343.1 phospholipid methyltransferase-domain-containing protein [Lasiosphaeria miniovina]